MIELIMRTTPSEICKLLSVETRLAIIELLKTNGPLGANDISEKLNITAAAVSQHLRLLKQAGLVRSQRRGYWIPYSLNEDTLEKWRYKINTICTCGCSGKEKVFNSEQNSTDLKGLIQYEKNLLNELEAVRNKIKVITQKK